MNLELMESLVFIVGMVFLIAIITILFVIAFYILSNMDKFAAGQEVNDTEGMEDVEFCSGHLSWLDREFCEQLYSPHPP